MNIAELREKTKEELIKEYQTLAIEFKNFRFAKAKGEDKNPLQRRFVRRDIARVLTIMREKGWK